MVKKNYKIGEVSKKFGISIRLIRYYDSIGLLHPSFKDGNGYRYYNTSDLFQLEQILLLQMLNFSLQEIKELLASNNISEELIIQEEFIANKIKYLSQIQESIKRIRSENTNTITHATDYIKRFYSAISTQFHGDKSDNTSNKKDQHEELIILLRKILEHSEDEYEIYNQILQFLPGLNSSEYSSQFFMLLRLAKGNRFKLDEIERIEKKIIKIRLSLDSTIM